MNVQATILATIYTAGLITALITVTYKLEDQSAEMDRWLARAFYGLVLYQVWMTFYDIVVAVP